MSLEYINLFISFTKADCPDLMDNLSKSQNDVVLNKLTQILSYIRTGNKKKNKKKMDFDLEKVEEEAAEVKTEPVNDGFDIFSGYFYFQYF